MARFITIGYGDRAGYDRTAQEVLDAAHAHDAQLAGNGVMPVVGVAGSPVQVRNHDGGGTTREDGPFLRSSLPVAGFAVIEAADLDEAVRLVSGTPCAVAGGIVEVWPIDG